MFGQTIDKQSITVDELYSLCLLTYINKFTNIIFQANLNLLNRISIVVLFSDHKIATLRQITYLFLFERKCSKQHSTRVKDHFPLNVLAHVFFFSFASIIISQLNLT